MTIILDAWTILFEAEDFKVDKIDMKCISLAEGTEQFEIACEFDSLPVARIEVEASGRRWMADNGLNVARASSDHGPAL